MAGGREHLPWTESDTSDQLWPLLSATGAWGAQLSPLLCPLTSERGFPF